MAKFTKKPIEVEAVQWFKHGDHPRVKLPPSGENASDLWGWVVTPEGGHRVVPGDWIITGPFGEVYPCKDNIFRATYDPVTKEKRR